MTDVNFKKISYTVSKLPIGNSSSV